MLTIRLKPMGRKHRKQFRVVVAEKHRSVSKFAQDILGWYNPHNKEHSFNQEKITQYLSYGIEMSDTVKSLFRKYGVVTPTPAESKPKAEVQKEVSVKETAKAAPKKTAAKKTTSKTTK